MGTRSSDNSFDRKRHAGRALAEPVAPYAVNHSTGVARLLAAGWRSHKNLLMPRGLCQRRRFQKASCRFATPTCDVGASAPAGVLNQRGASPLQVYLLRPVTDCNCVAARRGGEEAVGKALVRGTRTAYQAGVSGRGSDPSRNPIGHPDWRMYMRRMYGAKVTRLSPGELWPCLVLGPLRGGPMGPQQSAAAVVAACTGCEGPNKLKLGAVTSSRMEKQSGA